MSANQSTTLLTSLSQPVTRTADANCKKLGLLWNAWHQWLNCLQKLTNAWRIHLHQHQVFLILKGLQLLSIRTFLQKKWSHIVTRNRQWIMRVTDSNCYTLFFCLLAYPKKPRICQKPSTNFSFLYQFKCIGIWWTVISQHATER